ncbi:MAG: ABC transporter permease [Desulfobacteraceae bacterium]|nr:ABC transporter permease [Desulfobacteraceae bacterium]
MGAFIIRRLMFMVVVLFGVSVLMFSILMSFSPERRAVAYATSAKQIKEIPILVAKYGLDDPYHIQYIRWITQIFKGNFGYSTVASSPTLDAIIKYLPTTIELNLFSMPIIITLGIWLGTIAGIHRDTFIDHTTRIAAIVGWSLPTFLFALILLMIFYSQFQLFPPEVISDHIDDFISDNPDKFIQYTGMYVIDGLLNRNFEVVADALKHLVLPVVTQVTVVIAILVRVMRSSMLEEISKDYVITAKAKGVDINTIHQKHVKKNALLPAITISGWLVCLSIEGSVTVEFIFNRAGLGLLLVKAATQLDIPVVLAISLLLGLIYVVANLIIDVLYAVIDPRIRLN